MLDVKIDLLMYYIARRWNGRNIFLLSLSLEVQDQGDSMFISFRDIFLFVFFWLSFLSVLYGFS